MLCVVVLLFVFFFQAEDGIRDLVRSRGLGDVYKRQVVIDDENDISGIQSRDAAKLVFLRNCLLFWV